MIFNGEFVEPWEELEPRVSKLVFIGKNIDHAGLKKSFEECLATPENMRRSAAKRMITEQGSRLLGASQQNDGAKIQALIDMGVPVGFANGVSQTALHIAALWGNFNACTILVSNGANLNAQNTLSGATPLHMAAKGSSTKPLSGRMQCAQLIVDAGADVTTKDFGGRMAWEEAAEEPGQEEL